MAHDPFTLDLFNNTALTSGLGLGLATFPTRSNDNLDHDDDPPPSAPAAATALSATVHPEASRSDANGTNFHLVADRGLAKGWKSRARDSIGASRLAAEIERRQRSGPACCVSAGAAGESWSQASARGYFPR